MPVISSEYKAPNYPFSGDLQTILPALFRKVGSVFYERERIKTPDNDFLDLDWIRNGNTRLAILNHGLEGNTRTQYMLGMARVLHLAGWDVLAWNYRSCSGEINQQYRFYHSGETTDLHQVIHHSLQSSTYQEAVMIGFSVGGNITLKYLGEQNKVLNPKIKKAIVFSVPCHLASSAAQLAKFRSRIYMKRFLRSLEEKMRKKSLMMPGKISIDGLAAIKDFYQFDTLYTAPIHGYKSATEYWEKNSSLYFISDIQIPTLIVSAQNDPFLSPQCYPVEQVRNKTNVYLEMPKGGGHCGFYQKNIDGLYWSEKRVLDFIN